MYVNGKALLLIFLVVFAAAVATSFVLLSSSAPISRDVNFAESHSVVQVFGEVEPEGIEMDGPGMPT
jgi:flagellar basal body-associated protein FliL